jgi:hypothetical protein
MKTHTLWLIPLVLCASTLAGCSPGAAAAQAGPGSLETRPGSLTAPAPTLVQPPQPDDPAGRSARLAQADLARRLQVPLESVSITHVIGQEFSSRAFTCRASKDRIARDDAPATLVGFSILLEVSGRRYEYHASGQTLVFCRALP